MGVETIEEGCGQMEGTHSAETDVKKVGLG